ncbi:thioredoxin reductase [Acidovorax sp. HMWF018]|uniref:NAD(P)/FAD-dependent oxidoreductase n=1 Tax=Acidovorax sp. HMWF018 TaxID=2056855 RepID=UPI000D3ABD1E|nr:NAD(P)/FAD-dependent oxidoreductase [Acidovorax sp. HMWF018]PTT37472.1 thioredoxin reductase [Acidovorax sp. HMWF018]
MSSYDAIVVGGSYAGLSAAMQLARARRRVCVVDAGAPRNRRAAAAHGFFGQDGMAPAAMLDQARQKLLAYPTVTLLQGTVTSAQAQTAAAASADASTRERGSDERAAGSAGAPGFDVELHDGTRLSASKLVLAFGVQDTLPDIEGLSDRWGTSVLHCPYCHGYEFAGQRLGVLYHSPSSATHVQLIAEWGPTTLFLNGDPSLPAAERERLQNLGIAVEPARIDALEGPGKHLSGVRVRDDGAPGNRVVPIEALYVAAATRPGSSLAEQLGCAIDEGPSGPLVRTDESQMTSVRGVYAAGDVSLARHNATLASAEGVVAGTCAHQAMVFGD